MADDIASLGIKVETGQVDKAKRSLADLAAQGGKTEQSLKGVGDGSASAASKVDKYADSTKKAAKETEGLAGSLKATIAAFVSIQGAVGLGRIADEYTKFSAQLKLATRSQQEFAEAYSNSIRIARTSQSDIAGVGTLYARLNNSLRELGATQRQVADISETVALSLKVSGAGAAESASAMLQLSQAFGSGVLRGEEFNAVNEAAPGLLRALAESLKVPVGALREMASNGKLTSDVLANAFKDPALLENLRKQAKEVVTLSSSFTGLRNELTIAVGEFDKATGISSALASAISGLAKNADLLVPILGGLAIAAAAIAAPSIITGVTVLAGLIAALSGPVLLVIAGVTALGIAYQKLSKDGRTELQKLIDKEY